ncbi:hypothetical protein A2U01_0109344, partial [Trifolium medium]|nr:hypothetical protein [Trifolium medium]
LGARFNEVIRVSRGYDHCGMVEQAEMSIGFNYDELIIIGATRIGTKGRCALGVSGPGGVRQQLYEWRM